MIVVVIPVRPLPRVLALPILPLAGAVDTLESLSK